MRLAILGAGSYVARALIRRICSISAQELALYTRSPVDLKRWASERGLAKDQVTVFSNEQFGTWEADVVINFIGAGDPRLVQKLGKDILVLTEEWDRRVLRILSRRPGMRYIFASSGIATGEKFALPREANAPLLPCCPDDYYALAKSNAEVAHRCHSDLPIVDLRIFSFFSSEMSPDLGYFVSDVQRAILSNQDLITNQHNIARDYIHPDDLLSAIYAIAQAPPLNVGYDLLSRGPVRKFELLRRFESDFGLRWRIVETATQANKLNYYSEDNALRNLGYSPQYTALKAVIDEAKKCL